MLPWLEQLRRRKVVHWTLAYLASAWVVLQVSDTLGDAWDWSARVQRALGVLLAAGLLPAIGLAWHHGERGRQRVTGLEVALVLACLLAGLAGAAFVTRTPASYDIGPVPRIGRMSHVTNLPDLELYPSLSPDGGSVAFASGRAGDMRIYVQQIAGGRMIPVATSLAEHQRWPQWSPDGARILFQAGRAHAASPLPDPAGSSVFTVPALGGAPRRLIDAAAVGAAVSPAWSPDGARIAFGRNDSLFVMPADGGAPQRVAVGPALHAPRWSPDGERLAYVAGNIGFMLGTTHLANVALSQIRVVRLRDGRTHDITSGEWLDASPVWSPDGRSLWFVSDRQGGRDVYRVGMTPEGAPAGEPERITSGSQAHTIDLARDGRTLAYASLTAYTHVWSLVLPSARVASVREATQLTFGNEVVEGVALSHDGRWLAFDSDRSGDPDIWKISIDGGVAEQLTTTAGGDFVQGWSADGRFLSIHAFRGRSRDIFLLSVDGSGVEQVLATPAEEANGDLSPDGAAIAFESDASGVSEIYLTRRTGPASWSAPLQLSRGGGVDAVWSPDGKRIAYLAQNVLKVMLADGSGVRSLVGADGPGGVPEFAQWSRDGRTIYYKARAAAQPAGIWAVAADGGEPRLLVTFDDPAMPSLRREFATDGNRIYFTVAQYQSDIWAVEVLSGRR
jgi:Tol biopolymer transport system component